MEHPLDKIYNVSATASSGHPLDKIYGIANSQTPQQEMSKSLSDVGVPNIPVKEPGLIKRGIAAVGSAITDPFVALGGGVANLIRPAIGREADYSPIPGLFGGQVNPVGARDGKEVGAVDTAKQVVGNTAMAAANLFTGGEAAPVIAGGKALLLPTLKTAAKVGAIQGGAMGGGEALADGASPIETLLKTGVGSLLGAGTGLALGAGAKFTKNVVDEGFKKAASDLVPDVRNPFKVKTEAEILATPEANLGKLSPTERNIYISKNREAITKSAQENIDSIARKHDEELARLNTLSQQEGAAIRTVADDTAIKLADEEKALKEAMATQSIKEAESLKPRLVALIKENSKEYVRLIDKELTPDIASSQVTQNEIASSIRKNIQANNPISQQQADQDIAALSKIVKKGSTVKDIYEATKQLRADNFGKTAGVSRTFNKDEVDATRLISRLVDFLKQERGVDLSEANKFWSGWVKNKNILVNKIQPYTAAGQETTKFNTFARQLTSTNPKDANFIKNLEDTFGIKVSDLDSRKILAKLDDNAKAKLANDIQKKAKADDLRFKTAQDKYQLKLDTQVKKGEITEKKAEQLKELNDKKNIAQLKADQRKMFFTALKYLTGVTLLGGSIPVIGKVGQGE